MVVCDEQVEDVASAGEAAEDVLHQVAAAARAVRAPAGRTGRRRFLGLPVLASVAIHGVIVTTGLCLLPAVVPGMKPVEFGFVFGGNADEAPAASVADAAEVVEAVAMARSEAEAIPSPPPLPADLEAPAPAALPVSRLGAPIPSLTPTAEPARDESLIGIAWTELPVLNSPMRRPVIASAGVEMGRTDNAIAGTEAAATLEAVSVASGSAGPVTPPRPQGRVGGRRGSNRGVDNRGIAIPEYPAESRRLREEGVVELEVEVTADGRVGKVRVLAEPGHPRLVASAIAAVRVTRFEPAEQGGAKVGGRLIIPFRFTLE